MITEQEKQRRKKVIDFARGNVRYEGVILSPEIEILNQKYINGEISNEEHSKLCIQQIKQEDLEESITTITKKVVHETTTVIKKNKNNELVD